MKTITLSILMALLLTAPASALITYRDENGTLHAVNNEDEIPEQYRKKTKRLKAKGKSGSDGMAPVEKVNDVFLVNVDLGTHGTYRFIVDTVEFPSTISSEIANSLKLNQVDRSTIKTFQGTSKVPMVILPEVSVAGRSVINFKISVANEDPAVGASGRLGRGFLERFDYKLDKENGRLFLHVKTEPKTPKAVMKE